VRRVNFALTRPFVSRGNSLTPYRRWRPGFGAGLVVAALTALVLAIGHEGVRRWRSVTISGPVEVIDGDSLRVNGQELRLEGVDAPEYRQTCLRGDAVEPCGHGAREALRALLGRQVPVCEVASRDRYGRGLARCRVGGIDVNAALVAQGQALAYGDYEAEEATARRLGRGIWGTRFERPADWRNAHPRGP
jgi:endonuclease YncB( thermonuclease family)